MTMTLTGKHKEAYDSILSSLKRELLFESRVHGAGHIERVIALGAQISQNECLNDTDTRILLLCCAYHDIGRENDWYDTEHGTRSAEKNTSWLH